MKINRDKNGRFKCDYAFTEEQLEYLKEIAEGHTIYEITNMINKKFNVLHKPSYIKFMKKKHNIKSGHIGKINSGCFKKGRKTHNRKKIGDEFTNKEGYTYVKIAEPNKWLHKQRYMYEKYHGKIPEGYKVVFLNQNRQDFSKENLVLVKNKDYMMCIAKKMVSNNSDITKLGIITAQIINKTKERKKEYGKA